MLRLCAKWLTLVLKKPPGPNRLGLGFFSFLYGMSANDWWGALGLARKNEPKARPEMYWGTSTLTEIILEADHLFSGGHFLAVYELLNRLKFSSDVEVKWRIGRVLYKLSRDETYGSSLRYEMVHEAYAIMAACMEEGHNSAYVYRWTAIILDAKNSLHGTRQRVRSFEEIKSLLLNAIELDPLDAVSLYMVGRMCLQLSRMSKFQRLLTKVLYGDVPESTYEEAYEYLLRSHEINLDAFYIPTLYLLGLTCFEMGEHFRARFYLNYAATLPARSPTETDCIDKAHMLLKHMDMYDVTEEASSYESASEYPS